MIIAIYPRVKYTDSKDLEDTFVPRELVNRHLDSLKILNQTYRNSKQKKGKWLDIFLKWAKENGQTWDREEWSEITLDSLYNYFNYWWKALNVEKRKNHLEADVDQDFINRYLEGLIDYRKLLSIDKLE